MTLLPNTTYYYRVKAINSEQESDYSDVISVTTLPDTSFTGITLPASTPTIYKINKYTNSVELYLEYPDKQENIEEYKITVSTNADFSSPILSNLTYTLNNNISSAFINQVKYGVLTIPNLNKNTTYYIRIKASNSLGFSGNRDTSIKTLDNINAPEVYGVTNLTAITARANWSKVKNATSYILDVATDLSFSELVMDGVDTGNVDFKDIPVLLENTTYYFRVKAITATSESNYSNVVSFTTLDDIATNPNLSFNLNTPNVYGANNIYLDTFQFIWYPVLNATEYVLDVSTSINFSSYIIENLHLEGTKHVIEGLTPGTIYYVRVKAINGTKESSFTTPLAISTLSNNINLTTPQLLQSNSIFTSAVIISWVKRNYANKYLLQISSNSNFTNILQSIFVGDIDTFTIEKLNPATTYYIRVFALNNVHSSNSSNIITINTNSVLPTITLNSPSEISSTSVRLSWLLHNTYTRYSLSIYKKIDYLTITQGSNNYLGDGFFNNFNLGNVSNYLVDIFLEASTIYNYIITGYTANGDYTTSEIGEFSTKAKAPVLQISTNGDLLEWSGNLNRIEVSTDKNFKYLVQGWHPRTVLDNGKINISNLTKTDICYFIRGYYFDTIKGDYSNIVSTFNTLPAFLPSDITDSSATVSWRKNNYDTFAIQIFVDNLGSFIPVTGYALPKILGDVDFYFIKNLTPDTLYKVYLSYFDKTDNRFKTNILPLVFKTNVFKDITVTSETGIAIEATITNISFDRCVINLPDTDLYQITVSKRQDFLTIDKYLEVINSLEYVLLLEPSTTYYINIYKVDNLNRTSACELICTTLDLPDYPDPINSVSVLSSPTVLNNSEVILNWTVLLNATGYSLEISETNTFNLLSKDISITYLDINKALVSGLISTKVYYSRVYGFNANSLGNYSNTVTVDTTP